MFQVDALSETVKSITLKCVSGSFVEGDQRELRNRSE